MANVKFFSASDDLITYLLFDVVVFGQPEIEGRRTGKMDHQMKPLRIKEGEITIVDHLVKSLREGSMNVNRAVQLFCEMNIILNFLNKWEDSEDLFEDHLKRYFGALLPSTGIAFHETDRYTKPLKNAQFRQTPSPTPPPPDSSTHSHHCSSSFIDVAVFATRDYKVGDIVDLKGGLVDLTEEEDDTFRASGSKMDFSVLWSSRKDCFCLLLGPARFVNHDCRNNVEFMPIGAHMKFKVVEPIMANEQIFTRYGDHYFDTDNASCLCSTCEQMKRGAFSILPPASTLPLLIEPAKIEKESSIASGSNLKQEPNTNQLSLPHLLKTSRRSSSLASSSTSSLSSLDSETSESSTKMSRLDSTTASYKKKSRQHEYEKRRSERTNIVVDEFRTRPRLIHPPLAPPAGYLLDYKPFDPIKKELIFEGRRQASDGKGKKKRGRITDKEKERLKKKEEKEKEAAKLGKRKRSESSPANSKGKGRGRPPNKKPKPSKFRRGHDSSADESSSEDDSSEEEESSEEDSSEEEEEVKKLLTPKKVLPKIRKKKVVPTGRTKHWCYSDEEGFDEAETLQDIVSKSVKAGLASLEAEEEAEDDDSSSEDSGDESFMKEGTAKSRSMIASTSNQSNESKNNRITRRNSIVPPPNLPSTSATGKLARVVKQLALVAQPRSRSSKQPRASLPNLPPTTALPSSSPHQTRATQPIPESLKHLIHSTAVTNGVGGWDEAIKRYLSPKKKGPNRRHSVANVGGSNSIDD